MTESPVLAICSAAANNDLELARTIMGSNPDVLVPRPPANPAEGEVRPYEELDVGDSPLMRAVNQGHIEMVRWLLENGADPDEHHGHNFGLPSQAAIWKCKIEIVNLLLDFGAEPGKSTANSDMELTGYGLFCRDSELINRIYAAGGRADIYAYIKANLLPVIGELLDHCPDVPANKPSVKGSRTILEAIRGESAWCGNADALSMALAVRPISGSQVRHHLSSLIASHNRLFPVASYLRCINMLFDAAPQDFDHSDYYPLHRIAQRNQIEGRVELTKLLIERGIDPKKLHPESGKTALEVAVENNRSDMVEFLMSI